ncbi:MAG: alpha-amylase family glycosyl hydrolase [Pseudomonadota bacterium]
MGLAAGAALLLTVPSALGSHTPPPTGVTIAGSLQSELGCAGDWDPACGASALAFDAADAVWQATFSLPAGSYEYKAALNGSWTENYGLHATQDGANIPLALPSGRSVTFLYDHETHWVADSVSSTIVTAPGSFQSELGCPGDWMPDCLRSWLQDPDGDGRYTRSTTALPPGAYEVKAAIDQSWSENYGQGGVRDGANIAFTVPTAGSTVAFSYVASTHVLTVAVTPPAGQGHDDNVQWDGLRHDSRDLLYRTPGGAVPAGTPVLLRLRTFHGDVTSVRARVFDVNANEQRLLPLHLAAEDVSCYQAGLGSKTCDFWEVELPNAQPNNLWYRFVVSDGTDTDYYADDTAALDGGLGATSDDPVDRSFALTVYEPGFRAPAWARDAVIYQIFPDRFKNADGKNDPPVGTVRYGSLASTQKQWGDLPEGYCRNYATSTPCGESPNGRDYFGGDLKGVRQKLDYLQELGVTAIYLNPIFEANSNHRYDTVDYRRVDPWLGDLDEFGLLVKQARERGIRVLLDGVFNHMSSDSPPFDRYHRFATVGACESTASPFRTWFEFSSSNVPCGTGDYTGWFGFDSIPVLAKSNPTVQDEFNAVARLWLERGAGGWRMDVSGDPSFPNGYWERIRQTVKAARPDALTISETWGKDTTLLRMLRGDRLDTTMNYRLRDAVVGLLAPQGFDSKGFPDSGRQLAPSEFASRLASIREDYADAAYFSAMNLLDSHDTERLLWTLTPGAETRAEKEATASNVAGGKRRVRLASLLQFGVAGAPTVYYGDEVGVTGDDDPDDRRTMPWPETGGARDTSLLAHYRALTALRRGTAALRDGSFDVLLADDDAGTVAFGRKTASQAAIVVVNRSGSARTVAVPLAGFVPAATPFALGYAVGTASADGATVELGPLSGAILVAKGVDLDPPAAPARLRVTMEGNGTVGLAWDSVAGAAGYDVYRSPVSGGGWVKANDAPLTGTTFTDTGRRNATLLHYVVRARDDVGNVSDPSNEVEALPHLTIGWANLQWPPSIAHTISAVDATPSIYGQVWIDGATNQPGPTPSLRAQLGYGPDGSDPASSSWRWVDAAFNTDVGNNDEFVATLLPEAVGRYDYAYRYSTTGGRSWIVADLDGIPNGYSAAQAGDLVVSASADTTAPATPTGLHVVSASPAGIDLAWTAVGGDASLYGYEVLRDGQLVGRVTGTTFTDVGVEQGATYAYAVRSVDTSFNRSAPSDPVTAVADLRTVSVTFTVEVPAATDATGRSVYIAGTLNRLDGGLPEWNPAGVALARVDATHWRITLTGREATQLEYKYALGSWDYVEKDAGCGEVANRQLTLAYGAGGTQAVNDVVPNWRNVAPCGN